VRVFHDEGIVITEKAGAVKTLDPVGCACHHEPGFRCIDPMHVLIATAAMLTRPHPVSIVVELHDIDIKAARVRLTIYGAFSVANHIGFPTV